MAGIQIIAKDKNGIVKQDYELSRTDKGKFIKVNELKGKSMPIAPIPKKPEIIHKKIKQKKDGR
jgi:hypothetical protein